MTRYCIKAQQIWEPNEHVVAIFDTSEAAVAYLCASELKRPRDPRYPYRQKSLLATYGPAWVEYYEHDEIPVNPELPK
jgi:hypothetical protein